MSEKDKSFGEYMNGIFRGDGPEPTGKKGPTRHPMDELLFGLPPQGGQPPKMHPMDQYLFERLMGITVEPTEETSEPGAQAGLSEAQAAQIEKYMQLGSSYPEARDLVLSAPVQTSPAPIPPGSAGNGTDAKFQGQPTMDELIRKSLGR